jgi:stearoyl-CoA desaturase (delta-9 desaturase)
MSETPRFVRNAQHKTVLTRAITLVVVVVPLLATAFAIVSLWQRDVMPVDLAILAVGYILSGLGITVGFHRFATHRSFKSHPVVEVVLMAFGSMAVEGSVIQWTADHWKHHKFADKPGDPHSPLEGLLHAHIGWFFGDTRGDPAQDARHLLKDPIARFMSSTFGLWVALGLAIPFLIDGWRGLLWGGLVRIFLLHHVTWSVNSICHQFGRRSFNTTDHSGNQWVVGLLGFGEGWHNNHHAFPESAFHGLRWYQIDIGGYLIRGLEKARLIDGVRRISKTRQDLKKAA